MVNEKIILEELSVIIDPDLHKDIVSLGFVQNIKIEGEEVSLDIELTTPACPIKNEFKKSAEEILLGISGVSSAKVNMTAREVKKVEKNQNGLADVRNIIAVSSSKGGVGKSTVSANIARELAARGFKTGLLDADIFGPSVPTLFNLRQPEVFADAEQNIMPINQNGLKIMSFGFLMGDGPAILRGPMVSGYIQQLLTSVAWGDLDYLIIDMPPGTGDIQLTITQTVQLTGAVIVTTREALSIVDVAKGIEMFEKVKVPMLGVVENMSHFICDNCDKKHYLFGSDQENIITKKYGLETLLELPILKHITNRMDKPLQDDHISSLVDNMVRSLGKLTFGAEIVPQYEFDDKIIKLTWPDGEISEATHFDLRGDCGCAQCVDEYTGEQLLQKENVTSDIKPEEIIPLGNYALKINWSDGHSSGIYPYAQIKKLSAVKA